MKRLRIVTEQCASSSGPGSLALVPIILTILPTHKITMLFLVGVKKEVGFNPALCELAGHLLIKGDLVCTFRREHHVKVICLLFSRTSGIRSGDRKRSHRTARQHYSPVVPTSWRPNSKSIFNNVGEIITKLKDYGN